MKLMTAFTTEIDEIDDALDELTSQIDMDALGKNSAGIVTCHFEFTNSDFIEKLSKRLPFEIIGMTTMASSNKYGSSMYGLALTVLTSDDVTFAASFTKPLLPGDFTKRMKEAYDDARGKLPGDPSLIITFFPYLKNLSGAELMSEFDKICSGIPCFGSLTTNSEMTYDLGRSIYNGSAEQESMAMLLLHGPIEPEFIDISIPKQNIRDNRGVITESSGCVLKKVNDLPILEYLKNMGIVILEKSTTVTPFMVYYKGSVEPVALGVFNINDDGSLLCGGEMSEGAGISLGMITPESIMATAERCVRLVTQSKKRDCTLLFSCVTRYVTLSPNQNSEMDLVSGIMAERDTLPYGMAYSGGEVCPVPDESGRLRNRFHNYTFAACVL